MTHINLRRDTAANWTADNPVLQLGETGWERDTRKVKMGDGTTAWNDLPYIVEPSVDSVNGQTGVVVLDAGDVGLGNVDDTPDMNKPVSLDQQAALDDKADLVSPAFTGSPTAPTPAAADSDTSIATTAFVRGEIDDITPPHMVAFDTSGVFSKATYPGLRGIRVRAVGGGGAGGGSAATVAGESSAGAGGASGSYSEAFIPASALAASETVTIGSGGAGVSGAAGNAGSDTSFGAFVTTNGGPAGNTMPSDSIPDCSSSPAQAGAGTGDIATPGGAGFGVIRVSAIQIRSGMGGVSHFAGGARGLTDVNSTGTAGSFGAGGSGAISRNGEGAHAGGAGGDGFVSVELFY